MRQWIAAITFLAVQTCPVVAADDIAGATSPRVFEPAQLNAMPGTAVKHPVRVRGVLRLQLTDGPYLYQDMETYGLERGREAFVTVASSNRVAWYAELYEAALVVITGDYRKSGCRGPDAACPHMKNELDPVAIEVMGYPDKSAIEKQSAGGQRPLRRVGSDDAQWTEIVDIVERLQRAVRERDLKALRGLIEPRVDRAQWDPEWPAALESELRPGGRAHWRLFGSSSLLASERDGPSAYRVYDIPWTHRYTKRSVEVCFDRRVRSEADWPNSEFDLLSENLGDPFACMTAVRADGGWWLEI
ncbi:MAG: hypothetical protein SGI91_04370 [Alphaproteobacteria bacterium]|jgi:hypothetical protein|nr:hypothetical protein [Alphaproteobacteria bacterium]